MHIDDLVALYLLALYPEWQTRVAEEAQTQIDPKKIEFSVMSKLRLSREPDRVEEEEGELRYFVRYDPAAVRDDGNAPADAGTDEEDSALERLDRDVASLS